MKLSFVQFHTAVQIRPGATPEYAFYSVKSPNKNRLADLDYKAQGVHIKQGDDEIIVPLANIAYARLAKEENSSAPSRKSE